MERTIIAVLPLTFLTVVDKGSISLAAEELNVAKSAVSQNLKRLEQHLGVKLAVRTTRRFSLTPAGERYYSRCKEMLAMSRLAATEMEAFGAQPSGPVKVTAPHAMIAPLIAPAVANLMAEFPKLQPNIVAEDDRLDLIANSIDVAFRVGDLEDSSLRVRKVGVLRNVLVASSALEALSTVAVSTSAVAALESLPYIAHAREQSPSVVIHLQAKKGGPSKGVKVKPGIVVNTVEALLAFTREGLGVAMLPEYAVVDDLRSGRLVRVCPDYHLKEKRIYAVHPYDKQPPKSILRIIEAVKLQLAHWGG